MLVFLPESRSIGKPAQKRMPVVFWRITGKKGLWAHSAEPLKFARKWRNRRKTAEKQQPMPADADYQGIGKHHGCPLSSPTDHQKTPAKILEKQAEKTARWKANQKSPLGQVLPAKHKSIPESRRFVPKSKGRLLQQRKRAEKKALFFVSEERVFDCWNLLEWNDRKCP